MLSVKRRRTHEDQASKPFFFFLFHLCQQAKRIGRLQEIKAKEQEHKDEILIGKEKVLNSISYFQNILLLK